MTDRSAQLETPCPNEKCDNIITIQQNWTAGDMNDYGGFILECTTCHTIFDFYVGRDIDASRVLAGAKKLADYNKDVEGDRESARKRCGLPPVDA